MYCNNSSVVLVHIISEYVISSYLWTLRCNENIFMHQDFVFVCVSMCFYYHFVCYCKFLLLVHSATGFTNIPPVIITVIIVSCFVLCCSLIWSNEHHCRYVYVSFSLSQLTCYYICMLQETGCVISVWSIVSLLAWLQKWGWKLFGRVTVTHVCWDVHSVRLTYSSNVTYIICFAMH